MCTYIVIYMKKVAESTDLCMLIKWTIYQHEKDSGKQIVEVSANHRLCNVFKTKREYEEYETLMGKIRDDKKNR